MKTDKSESVFERNYDIYGPLEDVFSKKDLQSMSQDELDGALEAMVEYDRENKGPGWFGVALAATVGLILGRASK